jgi:hypothetical protein
MHSSRSSRNRATLNFLNAALVFTISLSVICFGCAKRDREAKIPRETHVATLRADSALNNFWFNYRGQPDPGRRVWMRVSDLWWAELYPNGTVARYQQSGRALVNGTSGTTVRKAEGSTGQTLTANDGSFEVFVPDRTATNRILYFRHFEQNTWSSWRGLATVTPVE